MGRKRTGVYPASKSSILITFSYLGTRRKEYLKIPPTASNLSYAERLRGDILAAIQDGTFSYPATFPNSRQAQDLAVTRSGTVGELLQRWLITSKKYLQPSTHDDYKGTIAYHLIPQFGDVPTQALRRSMVRDWLWGLDLSRKRINNILTPLRSALHMAVEDGLITQNPVLDIRVRVREDLDPESRYSVDPLSPEEQSAVLAALPDQVRELIQFALWSGLRTSELLALQWGDIDFSKGVIRVARACVKGHLKKPKTKAGSRDVKLLGPARDALTAQKKHTYSLGKEIFHNPLRNAPWQNSRPLYMVWTRRLKKAGVRHRPMYQTRHTYASMLLSAGEDPMWVAHQMGHKDWGLIRRTYARWIPEANPDAGSKAERLFAPSPE